VVTITILSILSLGLFISTIVFYSNFNKVKGERDTAQQGLSEYINAQERNDARISTIADQARAKKQTVVGFLHQDLGAAVKTISGTDRGTLVDTMTRLDTVRLPGVAGATGWGGQGEPPSLAGLVNGSSFQELLTRTDSHIAMLEGRIASAQQAKTVAENDLQNEQERSQARDAAHRATLAAIQDELSRYRAEVEGYRTGTNQHRTDMDARVADMRQQFDGRERDLLDRIASLEGQRLDLLDQIDRLRGERSADLFQGRPEEALVDGRVVAVDPAEGSATIDLGHANKIRVGMSFAVYEEPSAIRPDADGQYPAGKGAIEVIRIDGTSAVCRVVSERAGNPVVRGDVIANAVYDPRKVYKFLVAGNFDTNHDGVATDAERTGITAMIADWGGQFTDVLSGDVDFLVMGQRPTLPPQPPLGSPIVIVEQFVQAQQAISRYDQLFEQATTTSLPVLNENRLRTLIGGF
jgi:hypothetical protein